MYLTKKKSFSHELVLPTLKDLLKNIKLIADDFYKSDEDNNINIEELSKNLGRKVHHIKSEDVVLLSLNSIFNARGKAKVKQIAEDFIIGNKLSNKASVDFVCQELITILGDKKFYSLDSIEIEQSISLFANLKESVTKDFSSTKIFAIPVVGISLKKEEKCKIGCIEFVNNLDFINQHGLIFNPINDNDKTKSIDNVKQAFGNADSIALIEIKNRDTLAAKKAKEEIIKRVFTLIKIILPRIGCEYCFVGTLGEEYLESRYSFLLKSDDHGKLTSLQINSTSNYISDNNLNLLEHISKFKLDKESYKDGMEWFRQCESIVIKYVNGEKVTDFEKRVWTAVYWLGETMIEKEINSLIIKYATCLEALFNSREGGISEQISEFTAFIVGTSKEERVNIYDDIKNLYKLRSKAVHGSSIGLDIDNRYLGNIKYICERAVMWMAHHSCQKHWQSSKGYRDFVKYILREYRFS